MSPYHQLEPLHIGDAVMINVGPREVRGTVVEVDDAGSVHVRIDREDGSEPTIHKRARLLVKPAPTEKE